MRAVSTMGSGLQTRSFILRLSGAGGWILLCPLGLCWPLPVAGASGRRDCAGRDRRLCVRAGLLSAAGAPHAGGGRVTGAERPARANRPLPPSGCAQAGRTGPQPRPHPEPPSGSRILVPPPSWCVVLFPTPELLRLLLQLKGDNPVPQSRPLRPLAPPVGLPSLPSPGRRVPRTKFSPRETPARVSASYSGLALSNPASTG